MTRRGTSWIRCISMVLGTLLLCCKAHGGTNASSVETEFRFEISIKPGLVDQPQTGRLFVLLAPNAQGEPRSGLGQVGKAAPIGFARDVEQFFTNSVQIHSQHAGYPITHLGQVPPGKYSVQAVLEQNTELRMRDAPGDLYSVPKLFHIDTATQQTLKLQLDGKNSIDDPPAETDRLKYVRLQSKLLSEFHKRPIFVRAGVLLPRDYAKSSVERYPVWVLIGGFGTRYTAVDHIWSRRDFRSLWLDEETPRFILVHLDGAGPLGDPYYVNSDVLGPYGDCVIRELLPEIDRRFRTRGPGSRVLSGTSTGGWVSLTLQVFYPHEFAGAWASCPDPVDFRELETTDIYTEPNIYVNRHGYDRPSARDLDGDTRYTLRDEIRMERFLGRGGNFLLSGMQWASWHAVYSPRDEQNMPKPLWDVETGKLDKSVAAHWSKYDLRRYVEEHWPTLAPVLRNKLHISSADADEYFLANAVRLLERSLGKLDPPAEAEIVYGPGKGHGWSHLTLEQMLRAMHQSLPQQ